MKYAYNSVSRSSNFHMFAMFICSGNALDYWFDISARRRGDLSHINAMSCDGVLKAERLFEFWFLQHLGWNVEWGPGPDETWRTKIGTALTAIYKKHQPHQVPLVSE